MTMAGQWFVPLARMHELLGPSNAGLDADLDALAAYVASLEHVPPPEPPEHLREAIDRGRTIFFSDRTRCAECHPPPFYTDRGTRDAQGNYLRHDVGTGSPVASEAHHRLNTPSLLGLRRSEPYLHDGRAPTLEDVLTTYNPDDRHGRTSHLSGAEVEALVLFLCYLRE